MWIEVWVSFKRIIVLLSCSEYSGECPGWDSLGLGVENTSIYLCFRFNSLGRDMCMQSTYLSAVQVSAIKIQRYCLFQSVIQLKLLVPSCCSFSGWFITIVPYSDYLNLHFWQDCPVFIKIWILFQRIPSVRNVQFQAHICWTGLTHCCSTKEYPWDSFSK